MSQPDLSRLEARIATLKRELANAERIRAILAESPELLDVLYPQHRNGDAEGIRPQLGRIGGGGPSAQRCFRRMVDYLRQSGNEPRTIGEMAESTGERKTMVSNVIYRTHPGFFAKADAPGDKRGFGWTIRENVEIPEAAE